MSIPKLSPLILSSVHPAREAELRRLRKANVEFEEQNAVLQRHIKDMCSAKDRLEAELGQDELRTQALHKHLLAIKHTLVSSLSSVALPGEQPAPSRSDTKNSAGLVTSMATFSLLTVNSFGRGLSPYVLKDCIQINGSR